MRSRRLLVAASVGVSIAGSARADAPIVVREELDSSARGYVVEAAACGIQGPFDVIVDGRRCSSMAVPEHGGALRVHTELRDGKATVILEADATDTNAASVRASVRIAKEAIERRVADSTAPLANVAHAPRLAPFSPELRDLGIGFIAVGLVTLGVVAVAMRFYDIGESSTDERLRTALWVTLGVGAGLAALGASMWIVGDQKVVRVTANVSPAGAALRVTF